MTKPVLIYNQNKFIKLVENSFVKEYTITQTLHNQALLVLEN